CDSQPQLYKYCHERPANSRRLIETERSCDVPWRFPCAGDRALWAPTRREFLYGLGASIGSVALTAMLNDQAPAQAKQPENPLAPKPGHLPAKAKACIFLMMEGGPSHIDTFDPKPKLKELHLKDFIRNDAMQSAMSGGKRYYVE